MSTKNKNISPYKLSTIEYPEFSERLRCTMMLRNYSVPELAKNLYLSTNTLYSYRTGMRTPDIYTLRSLCIELNVTADFLLGLQEDIFL